jgi:hypothetical protein
MNDKGVFRIAAIVMQLESSQEHQAGATGGAAGRRSNEYNVWTVSFSSSSRYAANARRARRFYCALQDVSRALPCIAKTLEDTHE